MLIILDMKGSNFVIFFTIENDDFNDFYDFDETDYSDFFILTV